MLEIIYQDQYLIAINKPHGLLVHRSKIAAQVDTFALQLLRDQIGQPVYPSHRLDRKTGGVLLFALQKSWDGPCQFVFQDPNTIKNYLAIVRGFTPSTGRIDYPLRKGNGSLQEAITLYTTLAQSEIPYPSGKFPTSRYSLALIQPESGRMHQIRKHFAHIFHPIIGDRPHGCNKQNRMWKEIFNLDTMLLHAHSLTFTHPVTKARIHLKAQVQTDFTSALEILNMNLNMI
ncbi:MAG TPA: pseudouridine synthase [Sphingobacteriaceae bacterium]|nr:pseudouridine synthase [Sphingobacteriaceae bacterium]